MEKLKNKLFWPSGSLGLQTTTTEDPQTTDFSDADDLNYDDSDATTEPVLFNKEPQMKSAGMDFLNNNQLNSCD